MIKLKINLNMVIVFLIYTFLSLLAMYIIYTEMHNANNSDYQKYYMMGFQDGREYQEAIEQDQLKKLNDNIKILHEYSEFFKQFSYEIVKEAYLMEDLNNHFKQQQEDFIKGIQLTAIKERKKSVKLYSKEGK